MTEDQNPIPTPQGVIENEGGHLADNGPKNPAWISRDLLQYSTVDLAIQLANQGWFVFPCKPDKSPAIPKDKGGQGFKDATTDPEQIKTWWIEYPDSLIGIYCEKSGFFALDLDKKNGLDGQISLQDLIDQNGDTDFVYGPSQQTPSGGYHILFSYPQGFKIPNNSNKLAPGIDLRSAGYICTGGPYVWIEGHEWFTPLTDAPAWLLQRIQNLKKPTTAATSGPAPAQIGALDDKGRWAKNMLSRLAHWRADAYDDWVYVGMALHAELGAAGFALWDDWSSQSSKYKPGECAAKWKSFNGSGITLGTLYTMAEEDSPAPRQQIQITEPEEPPSMFDTEPEALAAQDDKPQQGTKPEEVNLPDDYFVPELPREARIPDNLIQQAEGAGAWLNDYVDFAKQAAPMTAPEYHQILGLTLLATSVARRLMVCPSTEEIFPNIYAFIIGSSGEKKSGATKLAAKCLAKAKLTPLTLPGYMSPQGFLSELISKRPDEMDYLNPEAQERATLKTLFASKRLWLIDEAAVIFDWFQQQSMAPLKSLLLRLYDCPEIESESVIARGQGEAHLCYLTLCGISTPTELEPFLKGKTHWGNGIWARFIFVTPSWDRPPFKFYPDYLPIPENIPARLYGLFKKLPMPKDARSCEALTVSLAPGVWDLWEAYSKAVMYDLVYSKELSPRYHTSYKRLHVHAMKTAVLLAAADWADRSTLPTPRIEISHWVKAQMITEDWRRSLHRLMEIPNRDGQEDNLETKALRKIPPQASGQVITTRELSQKLNMSDQDQRFKLENELNKMQGDGLIKRIQIGKRQGWVKV